MMDKQILLLLAAFLFLCGLVSAGPAIVSLANALGPLVLALGLVVCAVRLVWHYTNRDR